MSYGWDTCAPSLFARNPAERVLAGVILVCVLPPTGKILLAWGHPLVVSATRTPDDWGMGLPPLLNPFDPDLDDGIRELIRQHPGDVHYVAAWTFLLADDQQVPTHVKEIFLGAAYQLWTIPGFLPALRKRSERVVEEDHFLSVMTAMDDARKYDEDGLLEVLDAWSKDLGHGRFVSYVAKPKPPPQISRPDPPKINRRPIS